MPKHSPGPKGSADSRLRPAALHSETCHPSTPIGPASSSLRPGHRAQVPPGLPRPDWPRRQRPPDPPASSAVPALVVRTRSSERTLYGGSSYRIGRDPKSDIVMADSRVSWRHGVLRVEGDGWLLEDVGSTNGTFVGLQRIERIPIAADCVVRLGNPDDGPILRCMPQAAAAAPARRAGRAGRVGRAAVTRRRARGPRRTAPARAVPRDPVPQAPPRPPADPGGPTPPASAPAPPPRTAPSPRRAPPPRPAAQRRPPSDLAHAAAGQGPAHRPHPRQRPGPARPRRLAAPRRTPQVTLRDLRDRRPRQSQRHLRQRPPGVLRGARARRTSSASGARRSGWRAASCGSSSTTARSPSPPRTWS